MSSENDQDNIFERVLEAELELLRPDLTDDSYDRAHKADLVGLAFSGGGIRSATFNLGVIQGLSKSRTSGEATDDDQPPEDETSDSGVMPLFDYLSTVSGGGYIGSWLSAMLHREVAENPDRPAEPKKAAHFYRNAVEKLQRKISTRPCGIGKVTCDEQECFDQSGFSQPMTSGFPPLEHSAVRHLRRYSNYLSPRLGLSRDLMALVSLFLRNLVVLQLGMVALVGAVLLLPYVVTNLSVLAIDQKPAFTTVSIAFMGTGFALLVCSMLIWRLRFKERRRPHDADRAEWQGKLRRLQKNAGWQMTASVFLLTLAFWLITVGVIPLLIELYKNNFSGLQLTFVTGCALVYFIAWLFSPGFTTRSADGKNHYWITARRTLIALITSLVFGVAVHYIAVWLDAVTFYQSTKRVPLAIIGSPLVLMLTSFTIALQLGLGRELYVEQERELWARTGGLVLIAALVWVIVFIIAVYSTPLLQWLGAGGYAVLFGWASASGLGAWILRSSGQGSSGMGKHIKQVVYQALPWFFLTGLAVFVAYGVNLLVFKMYFGAELVNWELTQKFGFQYFMDRYLGLFETVTVLNSLVLLLVFIALFLLFSWRVDLNLFSAHAIYKNRLVRAYLGASNLRNRNPNPFTGFDPEDDIPLAKLSLQRPIPIINTTINMSGGDDLAWQTRRAASFAFTPEYVGFETKSSKGIDLGGYRATKDYASLQTSSRAGKHSDSEVYRDRFTLGTVLSISGAAASPNMGYHTSSSISALLTIFNLRLGYWAGNPRRLPQGSKEPLVPSWRRVRPRLSTWPLLKELTGSANAESDWINLSDGGHFDNLGIYELVRRRCRLIVVTDAGCDPKHQFQDLADTIRKCWTDFGVHIFFPDLEKFDFAESSARIVEKQGIFGLIEYPDRPRHDTTGEGADQRHYGLILYLKCSLTSFEMNGLIDIRQYAESHPEFPHEPTSDQFFDENQFEAYRHLGFSIGERYRPRINRLFDEKTGQLDPIKVWRKVKELKKIKRQTMFGRSRSV